MNYRVIPLSQLSKKQVTELAVLHQRVMHTLLADLGLPVVEKYYQIACADSSVLGFCALSESGSPLGWSIGSANPDQLNRRLREARLWFVFQMVRTLVLRPRVMRQLLVSVRTTSVPLPAGVFEWIYLGVDTSARGQGLGYELMSDIVQAAREMNYKAVVLSVEVENKSAIALYTRAGFTIIDTFTEGGFYRHRMELTL
jgi:ribosomal protein S18 acetylase RimI-like enzyme